MLAALAGLPGRDSDVPGPMGMSEDLAAARELVGGLDALRGEGTVLFDVSTLRFLEPYSGLVFAALQDEGIPFVFDDETSVRQFGDRRDGIDDATLRMWQVEGATALVTPEGARRVGGADESPRPGRPVRGADRPRCSIVRARRSMMARRIDRRAALSVAAGGVVAGSTLALPRAAGATTSWTDIPSTQGVPIRRTLVPHGCGVHRSCSLGPTQEG